jgi:pyrroloquinoline quinone (PQQ) biosynthesis protein C
MANVAVWIEGWFSQMLTHCQAHMVYRNLMEKTLGREEALKLVEQIAVTHLRSPQILAFLYAASPKNGRDHIYHNLSEELGLSAEGPSHPDLLRRLGRAAGLHGPRWERIEEEADLVLRSNMCEPFLFGSMRDVALSVLLEVVAFEWFLSRTARSLGEAFQSLLSLETSDLEWFFHHSEVDIEHAQQGLEVLEAFVTEFAVDLDTLQNIAEITFRDNIYLKRYWHVEQSESLTVIGN